MENSKQRRDRIDATSQTSGLGRTYGATTDIFTGIDHRGAGSAFQRNNENQGLTLFTRPRLNLSYDNISAHRVFLPMLTENPYSIHRAIRVMLDPVIVSRGISSNLIDDKQAFMPILTNTLLSVSGFPDVTLNTYTSPEGMRKESYSMVDDVAEINSAYDLTATFANVQGDPISKLFHLWATYAGSVYAGDMEPYPDVVVENEVDYQTRIWRIKLDTSKTYVTKIGCASVAFPMASPLGADFNYSNDKPSSDENDQISVPFRCMGADYMDPILYDEFNVTVQYFNPGMRDGVREQLYHKLKPSETNAFNFNGYPRIDPVTLELEWWVPIDEYAEVVA